MRMLPLLGRTMPSGTSGAYLNNALSSEFGAVSSSSTPRSMYALRGVCEMMAGMPFSSVRNRLSDMEPMQTDAKSYALVFRMWKPSWFPSIRWMRE